MNVTVTVAKQTENIYTRLRETACVDGNEGNQLTFGVSKVPHMPGVDVNLLSVESMVIERGLLDSRGGGLQCLAKIPILAPEFSGEKG